MSRGGDAAWRNGEAARGKKRAGEVTAGKKQQGLKRAVALTTGFGHKHKTSRPLTPSSIHKLVDDFLFCIGGAVIVKRVSWFKSSLLLRIQNKHTNKY
jgi:hypothetical protein